MGGVCNTDRTSFLDFRVALERIEFESYSSTSLLTLEATAASPQNSHYNGVFTRSRRTIVFFNAESIRRYVNALLSNQAGQGFKSHESAVYSEWIVCKQQVTQEPIATMISPDTKLYRVILDHEKDIGVVRGAATTKESAAMASELLTENHEKFHAYFHMAGMHNHETHHLLAIYPLGATPEQIKAAYDRNAVFQKDITAFAPAANGETRELTFVEKLGHPEYYTFFLQFFRSKIAELGVQKTLEDFIFGDSALAESMFARLHGGLLHPLIHLGYGIEFDQPAIVAEALADAAIHDEFMGTICFPAERVSAQRRNNDDPSLMSLVQQLQDDDCIRASISEAETHNKLATDLMVREPHRLIDIVSRFKVTPETLDKKLAEMAQTSVYILAAAQRPDKAIALDFYMMHAANLSVFYPAFLQLPWLSTENKCRLVVWKAWLDLAVYASCKVPPLYPERITSYSAVRPGGWDSIFARACSYGDDGHTAKLIRAARFAAEEREKFPDALQLPQAWKGDLFLHVAHMVMDCVEEMDLPTYKRPHVEYFEDTDEEILRLVARWIRFCGTEVAWKDVRSIEVSAA